MKKKIKILSTQFPKKTEKEWEEFILKANENLYRELSKHFLYCAMEFKKKLDTSLEQVHGGGNGRRLLMTLKEEYKKVIDVL